MFTIWWQEGFEDWWSHATYSFSKHVGKHWTHSDVHKIGVLIVYVFGKYDNAGNTKQW